MTTATAPRRKPPARPDLSYLMSRGFKENPDYLLTAVDRGDFISCSVCRRVIGVGASKEFATSSALREGTAIQVNSEFRCIDHEHEATK